MSIHLITGIPGAGKTLYTVKTLVEELLPSGRPIFHNINGLNIDAPNIYNVHSENMRLWPSMPRHSVIIIDECQQVFPPRNPMSQVPPWVSHFEIHRHEGKDIYLVTQGPALIDRHLHPLIETHTHLYRPFGFQRSSIFKWNSINPTPNPKQTRLTAAKRNFSFPKKYFALYRSASQHTISPRPPYLLFSLIALVLLILGAAIYKLKSDVTDLGTVATDQTGDPADHYLTPPPCVRIVAYSSLRVLLRDNTGKEFSVSRSALQKESIALPESVVTLCTQA